MPFHSLSIPMQGKSSSLQPPLQLKMTEPKILNRESNTGCTAVGAVRHFCTDAASSRYRIWETTPWWRLDFSTAIVFSRSSPCSDQTFRGKKKKEVKPSFGSDFSLFLCGTFFLNSRPHKVTRTLQTFQNLSNTKKITSGLHGMAGGVREGACYTSGYRIRGICRKI